jgi:hypothetical protein
MCDLATTARSTRNHSEETFFAYFATRAPMSLAIATILQFRCGGFQEAEKTHYGRQQNNPSRLGYFPEYLVDVLPA